MSAQKTLKVNTSYSTILKNAIGVKNLATPKTPKEIILELNKRCQEKIISFLKDYIEENNMISTNVFEEIVISNSTKNKLFNLRYEYLESDSKKIYYHCAIFGKNDVNNYDFKKRINKTDVWKNIRDELHKIGFSVVIITSSKIPNIWLINTVNKQYIYEKINNHRILNELPDIFDENNENNELWHGLNNWLIEKEDIPEIKQEIEEIKQEIEEIKQDIPEIKEETIENPIKNTTEITENITEITENITEITEIKDNTPKSSTKELFLAFPGGIIVIDKPEDKEFPAGTYYFNLFITSKNKDMCVLLGDDQYPIKRLILGGMCDVNDKFN